MNIEEKRELNAFLQRLHTVLPAVTDTRLITDFTDFKFLVYAFDGTDVTRNLYLTTLESLRKTFNRIRIVTAAGAITVTLADKRIVVKKTSGAATTVNLPASPDAGDVYIIIDGKGDAATNNITVVPAAGTINGAANNVISTNYGKATYVYNGTEWNLG